MLTHQIATNRNIRVGAAPNNFPTTLAGSESDLARETVQDPYDLDFLAARLPHFFIDLLFFHLGLRRYIGLRAHGRPGRARAPGHVQLLRQRR